MGKITEERTTPDGKQTITFDPAIEKIVKDPNRPGYFTVVPIMVTRTCGGQKFTYDSRTHTLVRDPNNVGQCIVVKLVDPGHFE